MRRRDIFKGLSSGISSPTGTAVLGSVDLYLGQCIRESFRGGRVNSGSSVHSVGRAKVFSPTPLVDAMVPPQPVYPSPQPPHSPPGLACKLPFLMQLYLAKRPDRQMDVKVKTSYLIQTFPLCYRIVISQRKNVLLCHIKKYLHFIDSEGKYSSGLQGL